MMYIVKGHIEFEVELSGSSEEDAMTVARNHLFIGVHNPTQINYSMIDENVSIDEAENNGDE